MDHDTLSPYKDIVGLEAVDQLYQLAEPLKHIKLVHVNSTATGGGVAEILQKFIPITNALGINTSWEVIQGSLEFFQTTKDIHNAIQGKNQLISPSQLEVYEEVNRLNSERLREKLENADVVIIHDPQPLPLIKHFPNRKGKWIWRCHIDASHPSRRLWKYLRQFIEQYDASIFSLAEFTHPLSHPMFVIAPSIDPLSDKNRDLDSKEVEQVHKIFDLDPERPIILQVSRYDRFKDPVGVIEAYKLAQKTNPDIQLVLAGNNAADDPEGEVVLKEVQAVAKGDPNIHVLLMPGEDPRTINALQRAADIILQKSIKEGFGLTVTETLWKGKAVIGGNTGGIRLQVIQGETGYVVNTPEGAAYRIRYFLQYPEKMIEMGKNGKEFVREKFLITRQVREYLTLIYSLIAEESDRIELPMVKQV